MYDDFHPYLALAAGPASSSYQFFLSHGHNDNSESMIRRPTHCRMRALLLWQRRPT